MRVLERGVRSRESEVRKERGEKKGDYDKAKETERKILKRRVREKEGRGGEERPWGSKGG